MRQSIKKKIKLKLKILSTIIVLKRGIACNLEECHFAHILPLHGDSYVIAAHITSQLIKVKLNIVITLIFNIV